MMTGASGGNAHADPGDVRSACRSWTLPYRAHPLLPIPAVFRAGDQWFFHVHNYPLATQRLQPARSYPW